MTMARAGGHASRIPGLTALTMSPTVAPAIESTRWHR